jgi:YVTN family beta-propeller protein
MKAHVAVLVALALCAPGVAAAKGKSLTPSRSTTITLAKKDSLLLVVNRESNSLAVLQVRKKKSDTKTLLAEVGVGIDPRCVAADAKGTVAYVTNAASGTVSVVALTGDAAFNVVATIPVGTEPRGCALTPNGKLLFVANHTSGTVSVIDTTTRTVVQTVDVGGNPWAVAITNDNDKKDDDETVFVTDFFSRLISGKQESFDDARQGLIWSFPSGARTPVALTTLSPLADSGFTATRAAFCLLTDDPMTAPPPNETFCPDPMIADPMDPVIANDVQGAFPNQLASAVIQGGNLFVPNIGASPEPPVVFNVNVQGLVHVVDVATADEVAAKTVNLNAEVKAEADPTDQTSLDKLFSNDLVAIDAARDGSAFFIVSRGGNFVFRATLDGTGKLTLGDPPTRIATGNLPNGIVVSSDGTRAYVNNELNLSVTSVDLASNAVLDLNISTGTPPPPGTFAHAVQVGKLAFFTALGVAENGLLAEPLRDIDPHQFRGRQSNNAWSSCGSCHPDGLTDNVAWIFTDGPRNTISLDAFFAKDNPGDQRISNWSGIRSSVTDFNNNSRNVQGGIGFAFVNGDPMVPNPNIFNHGISQGASDALDLQTLWVQTIRPLNQPQPANVDAGRTLFADNCASCHGGAKWTQSQVLYLANPASIGPDPMVFVPRDPGLTAQAGGQIDVLTSLPSGATIDFLLDAGAFDPMNPVEIKANGDPPLGNFGFNVPSLLGVASTAPYFHDGSAATLPDVFERHLLGVPPATIASTLNAGQEGDLIAFLDSIDGQTVPFRSLADDFRDLVAGGVLP